jgi:hypothetical protein
MIHPIRIPRLFFAVERVVWSEKAQSHPDSLRDVLNEKQQCLSLGYIPGLRGAQRIARLCLRLVADRQQQPDHRSELAALLAAL